MKPGRIAALAGKEWREILRDRVYLMLAFVLPTVLMLVFGYGLSQEVEGVGIAALDEDRSPASRAYLDHFARSRHFRFLGQIDSPRRIDALLASGRARVVIWIGPDFHRDLEQGRVARVMYAVDGTFTLPARTLRGYVEAINAAASAEVTTRHVARLTGLSPERVAERLHPVKLQVRYLYNEEARSIWTIAPAMLMLILLLVPPLLMAVSVVREKETGAIYNVRASTVTRGEFITGKLLPNLLVAAVNAAALWVIAVYYFGAPFKGSPALFVTGTVLYFVGTSAAGLLVSLAVRTQPAAIIITTMAAIIVATQFSGLFAPIASMTLPNQLIARAFPAGYYYEIVMGSFLKRSSLAELAPQLAFLAALAVLLLALCHRLFRKRTRS